MKVSVSLSDEDVAFLDEYAEQHDFDSRSAVLQRAVQLLRTSGLGPAYADAWADWDSSEDSKLWERTLGDGVR